MTIEDLLRDTLAERLDGVDVPPGDVHRALREGTPRHRRTTWALPVAACLAAITGGAAVTQLVDLGSDSEPGTPSVGATDWTRLPDPPLSPRAQSLMVWTGEELLVIGGEVDNLCPPNADCASPATTSRDGAAYDPDTGTWRALSNAPFALAPWTPHAVLGDTLVVANGNGRFFAYDASGDEWRDLPAPPDQIRLLPDEGRGLTAFEGLIYAQAADGTIATLHPPTRSWSRLPKSPHQPRIEEPLVVPTPEGIVVIGQDSSAVNDGTVPSYLLAELYRNGEWTRLQRSDILGGWGGWHWTGERLVSPYRECMDGGQTNNYGRCIPTGGALDPATGTWEALDPAPMTDGGWSISAAEGSLVATWSAVYDDADGSWTPIDRPKGALSHGVSATFADGRLFAFGGVDWEGGLEENLSNQLWVSTP